jgi:hypothetical protein
MGTKTKPEIIGVHSYAGSHNSAYEQSRKRVSEGGSWKRQRVIEIIPSRAQIYAKVAHAHRSLAFPPNQPVYRYLALGQEVGEAYSNAIAEILAQPGNETQSALSQWEYILTIEDDNMPPSNGVIQLIEDLEQHPEFACVGGLYWCKGPGGCAHIWGDVKDPLPNYRPQVPLEPQGLQECYGTSMGFNLWRLDMFKDPRLRRPWFKTVGSKPEDRGMGTQDLYFWGDAKKYGYRCAVDTRVLVGHYDGNGDYGPADMVW